MSGVSDRRDFLKGAALIDGGKSYGAPPAGPQQRSDRAGADWRSAWSQEPGTGEIDYAYIMRVLRELNYKGYLDTEMGTSTTPENAMQLARKLSLEN